MDEGRCHHRHKIADHSQIRFFFGCVFSHKKQEHVRRRTHTRQRSQNLEEQSMEFHGACWFKNFVRTRILFSCLPYKMVEHKHKHKWNKFTHAARHTDGHIHTCIRHAHADAQSGTDTDRDIQRHTDTRARRAETITCACVCSFACSCTRTSTFTTVSKYSCTCMFSFSFTCTRTCTCTCTYTITGAVADTLTFICSHVHTHLYLRLH